MSRAVRFNPLSCLLGGLLAFGMASRAHADPWEQDAFAPVPFAGDFGGVGLLQTPTARFAPDGQLSFTVNRVNPYDRYSVTAQVLPNIEATLRYTSVQNRLYSPFPEFSGNQTYKDRGFDVKVGLIPEGDVVPAIAVGFRDFLGTGLFSSEYVVANKRFGALDVSLGMAWGNLGSRGDLRNPFTYLSSRFRDRRIDFGEGGDFGAQYFKGRRVGIFGGVRYDGLAPGLSLKAEYDSNNYQNEALGNRFRVALPINFGVDYRAANWLHLGAGLERGNTLALRFTLTTNVSSRRRPSPLDPKPPAWPLGDQPGAATKLFAPMPPDDGRPLGDRLAAAIALQGGALYSADVRPGAATLYLYNSTWSNEAKAVGRFARAAFSVLPAEQTAVTLVFLEGGMAASAVTVPRAQLAGALTPGRGSTDELWVATQIERPPLGAAEAPYQGAITRGYPGLFYAIRPGFRYTIGRPEAFMLYQAWLRLNGTAVVTRNLSISGSVGLNLADNFDRLRIPSDSVLPRVRSDIKEYLRNGRTSIVYLMADYNFDVAPNVYGHLFGGLLEEMYGGAGGELLYKPADRNWAVSADVAWVRQRGFSGTFGFRDYATVTGGVTAYYRLPGPQIEARLRLARYLAKDYGFTFDLSRRFRSGVVLGGFFTRTNVPAEQFGEGSFDKGLYLSVPLDLLFNRPVRGGVGIAWRPLIRDGGQQLVIRQPVYDVIQMQRDGIRRDWVDVTK